MVRCIGACVRRRSGEGHSVTEELRRRLETSFDRERIDPALIELQGSIVRLAGMIELDLGETESGADPWQTDPTCFAAFAAGVQSLIEHYKPAGEAVSRPGVLLPKDDPETIGRTLARLVLRK